jgi:hypothetical protein
MRALFPECIDLQSQRVVGGGTEVCSMMHSLDCAAIVPVSFLFQSLSAACPARKCWLWVHPAAAAAAAAAVAESCCAHGVEMEDLTGQLLRFSVRGSMASLALARALIPSDQSFDAATADASSANQNQAAFREWWTGNMDETLRGAAHPPTLQLLHHGAVVAGEFDDPRWHLPQQLRARRQLKTNDGRLGSSSSSSGSSSSMSPALWHPALSLSKLWSSELRRSMFDNRESSGASQPNSCFLFRCPFLLQLKLILGARIALSLPILPHPPLPDPV